MEKDSIFQEVEALLADRQAPGANLQGFLRAVLPALREGELFARFTTTDEIAQQGENFPQNKGFDSVEALAAGIREADLRGKGVWFGLASFGPLVPDEKRPGKMKLPRTYDNARRMQVFAVDVDCGEGEAKRYKTLADALPHAFELEHLMGLPASLWVCSGYGLHLYWVLEAPLEIADWHPVAARFKRALVASDVVQIDPKITDDAARVLRPVGTTNKKRGDVAPVYVLRNNGVRYALWQVEEAIARLESIPGVVLPFELPAGRPVRRLLNTDLEYTPDFPKVSAHAVAEQCAQIRWHKETGSAGNYDHWLASIGTIKHSIEGEELAHEWSSVAPGYDYDATQDKLDDVFKTGPALCSTFSNCNPTGCQGCRFAGKVKTPLQTAWRGAEAKAQAQGAGAEYLARFALVPMGADVLVFDAKAPRESALMRVATFKTLHGNRYIGGKPMPDWFLRHPERVTYRGVGHYPGQVPDGHLNLFGGFATTPMPGDVTLFLDFVREVICGGRDLTFAYVLRWMAHLIQRPWELPEVALVLAGPEGIGKGTFVAPLAAIVGDEHVFIGTHAGQIGGKFNGHVDGKFVVNANEAAWAGRRDEFNALKALITDRRISFEQKGLPARTGDNFARVILTTNEGWAIPAGVDSRRFCVADASPGRKGDFAYFERLNRWLANGGAAALHYYLLNEVDISDWNPRIIPQTAALRQQRWETLKRRDPVAAWLGACLEAGAIDDGALVTDGWPEQIASRTLENSLKHDAGRNAPRWADAAKALQKLLPPGVKRVDTTRNHTRFIGYALPPLAECRAHFETATGTKLEAAEE